MNVRICVKFGRGKTGDVLGRHEEINTVLGRKNMVRSKDAGPHSGEATEHDG